MQIHERQFLTYATPIVAAAEAFMEEAGLVEKQYVVSGCLYI